MVYLYKCPFCVFGEMDRTKGCGSDDFISTAFLSVSPSINHLTEAMSLKMFYRHLHIELEETKAQELLIHGRELIKYSPLQECRYSNASKESHL